MLRALWESKWLWRLVLARTLLVGYAMARAIAQISAEDFTLQPSSLILAFLCAFLGHLSQFLNWVLVPLLLVSVCLWRGRAKPISCLAWDAMCRAKSP